MLRRQLLLCRERRSEPQLEYPLPGQVHRGEGQLTAERQRQLDRGELRVSLTGRVTDEPTSQNGGRIRCGPVRGGRRHHQRLCSFSRQTETSTHEVRQLRVLLFQPPQHGTPHSEPKGNQETDGGAAGDGDRPGHDIGRQGQWQRADVVDRWSQSQYAQHPAP